MLYLAKARERASRAGMQFIKYLARHKDIRSYMGSAILEFCRSLVTSSGDRYLRKEAARLGKLCFDTWRSENRSLPSNDDPLTIVEYVRIYGAAECLGLQPPGIKWRIMKVAKKFGPREYLGYDPRVEAPPSNLPDWCECGAVNLPGKKRCERNQCRARLTWKSPYRTWCLALTSAYCGERYGVPLGARYRDVLRGLPLMRPYPNSRHVDFYDAIYTVTHIIYTLNDYGRFRLVPDWLPWEYEFLKRNLKIAVIKSDPDMVGEIIDSLRAFGIDDNNKLLKLGYDFLLDTQSADGSWGRWDWESLYTGFHSTWAAIDGLRSYQWTGPRLLFPRLLSMLQGFTPTNRYLIQNGKTIAGNSIRLLS